MITKTVEGIIVRTYPSGDSDLVLRVVSTEQGKISLFARGVRSGRKGFGGGFDMLDWGRFELSNSRGSLLNVRSFISKSSFPRIRTDLDRVYASTFLCEAFDALTHEESGDGHEIFEALKLGLTAIDEEKELVGLLRGVYFALAALMAHLGYFDRENCPNPSARELERLVVQAEHLINRQFTTKGPLFDLLRKLKSEREEKKVGNA